MTATNGASVNPAKPANPVNLPGARSHENLRNYPPVEDWDHHVEYDAKAHPRKVPHTYSLIPTICFNCESSCGLLAYVDHKDLSIKKFEGNPAHPGSRGRNCAKGPATINQVHDPERILYPLKRVGERGSGQFERVSWDEALADIASRIRTAIVEDRKDEVMYHVGRPGEDGFAERVLQAWGVDGHNSHTNVCSSGGRSGYTHWMGYDRPSPDYANAKAMLLLSSHLETGHYFNPHAQRIMEAKQNGAKLVVLDLRLSNTASHADLWISPWPGSEGAIFLSVASYLLRTRAIDKDYLRRWVNWDVYLERLHPDAPKDFEVFLDRLTEDYAHYTFEFAAEEAHVPVEQIEELARIVADAGTSLATHTWRSAAAGNLGGWQITRSLFFLNVLTGSVGTVGGTHPNGWDKFIAHFPDMPEANDAWSEMLWPSEYPLTTNEMSILLPHLLKDGRGRLEVYFSRVYNPLWVNPDGFTWIDVLKDETKIGLHVALTPTWSESATFADYVLPMGHASERHDTMSFETHASKWLAFRQPVTRVAMEQRGMPYQDTRDANPGEVWEENEFWFELSWQIDPDGSLGIRKYFESKDRPGEKMTQDEYYDILFENSVPGLPAAAQEQGLTPLAYMRKYGVFEVAKDVYRLDERPLTEAELDGRVARRERRAAQAGHPGDGPAAGRRGRRRGRRARGRHEDRRLAVALAQARALLHDAGRLGLAGAGDPGLHRVARLGAPDRPGQRRVRADAELPAAHADPHPVGQREVPQRDRQHPPAVVQQRRRRAAGRDDRRPGAGHHRDRPLRRPRLGDRGDPARRGRPVPPHGPLDAGGAPRAAAG